MSTSRNLTLIIMALVAVLALVGCTREITTVEQIDPGASNCFNCHTDDPETDQYGLTDKQLEWSFSNHGIGAYVGYAGGRNGCSGCHSGAGFVARLDGATDVPYATTIGCWACHAPHTTGDFALRINEPQPLSNGLMRDIGSSNICTACHVARTAVDVALAPEFPDSTVGGVPLDQVRITSSHWGGHHGPQGEMFYGNNGYHFDGYTYRTDVPPAHDVEGMTRCFGCHGNANPVVDLGGHSFQQRNTAGDMNVASCNRCHDALVDFDVNGVQTETAELLETLHGLLETLGLVDVDGHPISGARGTEVQVGAAWNFINVEEDRSMGVHNPNYIHDLLTSSIAALGGAPAK
ncbi:hypothetical protein KDM41_08815 [bacterium]|nr:hypothetical protein [bacterium]